MQSRASDEMSNQTPSAATCDIGGISHPPTLNPMQMQSSEEASNMTTRETDDGITAASTSGDHEGEEEKMTDEAIREKLFIMVMKGNWKAVLEIYKDQPQIVQTATITRSKETALHIAISDSKTDVVKKLLKYIDATKIPEMIDDRGQNPLHLAASLGQAETCKLLVKKNHKLIKKRNEEGETPLFLAARHGTKGAFYALHRKCPDSGLDIKHAISHCRRNSDGNNILHVSILGEYFGKH